MTEKVIHEIKIVETEDGFRIEIKGDKEAIRRMLGGFGAGFPFGHGFRSGFRPGFWQDRRRGCGPWQEGEDPAKKA